MREYAEVQDTGRTFQVGRRISSLESEARAAGRRIQDILEATEPGSRFGARRVLAAARELGADVLHDGRTLANGAEALGEATAAMSVEMEQVEWESTATLVQNNGLFRSVNAELTGLGTPAPPNAAAADWIAPAGGAPQTLPGHVGAQQGGAVPAGPPGEPQIEPAPPAAGGGDGAGGDPDIVTATLTDGPAGPWSARLDDLSGLSVEQVADRLDGRT